ncbi:MAG: ABC transporter ATP-binding protein [Candidatus Dormiibacterota bacterium]
MAVSTPAPPAPAVEVAGLQKRYGARWALRGLDLQVPAGSITALLGPNGAGKTTTIEILEGFRRADAGHVRILGLDPRRERGRLRAAVGVMLQEGGLNPSQTCAGMLRLVARQYAHPLDPAALLQLLGLARVAKTRCRRLSGGERQRLGLALAVVGRPALVFLDEPTAGLDPEARQATWRLLERLREDGVTVLLTTHYLGEAERLADRVLILAGGRLVAEGSPRELARERRPGLRLLATPGLMLEQLVAELPAGFHGTETAPGDYRLDGPVTPGAIAALTGWCAKQDVLVERLEVGRHQSLEETYLSLTRGAAE